LFVLNKAQLSGHLPDWGAFDLTEIQPLFFQSRPPIDSAGEFQIKLSWLIEAQTWSWQFSTGLFGTRTKGAELSWRLKRSSLEPT
jgi:hypothetical protein